MRFFTPAMITMLRRHFRARCRPPLSAFSLATALLMLMPHVFEADATRVAVFHYFDDCRCVVAYDTPVI